MKRDQRLRTPADFRRAREQAPRGWPHPLLVLYVVSNDLGRTRVGVTVSSRVGNAVIRNRVRRRLKEALRGRFDRLVPGVDVLLIARPASARAGWGELSAALDSVLARAGATRPIHAGVQAEVNSA
ncbi:MAG: ribonuclease P protein component [Chloroflexota bacterium]|nr:ribonuclease P protein component [Chloroflexota bacterium]